MSITTSNLKTIDWEITSACQAACPICVRKSFDFKLATFPQSYTTVEEFARMLDGIDSVENFQFCSNIGDPMTNRDIVKIVDHARASQKKIDTINIHTNGGIGRPDAYAELAKRDIVMVFAVDGIEELNALHRYGVEWDALERNIKSFAANKTGKSILRVQFLVWDHNIGNIPDFVKWCRALNVDEIYIRESYGPEIVPIADHSGNHVHALTKKNTDGYRKILEKRYLKKNSNFNDVLFDWRSLDINQSTPVLTPGEYEYPIVKESERITGQVFPDGAPYKIRAEVHLDEIIKAQKEKDIPVRCGSITERTSGKQYSVFITHDNFVLPCCIMSGRFTSARMPDGGSRDPYSGNFIKFSDLELFNTMHNIGLDKFNLSKQSLLDIIKNDCLNELIFEKLTQNKKLSVCTRNCAIRQ